MNASPVTRRWHEAAGDPARMVDEISDPPTALVTREFLRAKRAQVREQLASLQGEPRSETAGVRRELRPEIAAVRGGIAAVRGGIAAVRGDIWRVVLTGSGAQVVLVGILVTTLIQVLR